MFWSSVSRQANTTVQLRKVKGSSTPVFCQRRCLRLQHFLSKLIRLYSTIFCKQNFGQWKLLSFYLHKKEAHDCDVNSFKSELKLFPLPLDCMDIDDMAESDNSFHLHSRADSAAAETGLLLDRQLPARPGPCTEKRELQQDLVI